MTRLAMIHSLKEVREVTIVQKIDDNHVIAEFEGKHYTAIDNPFNGLIYVDDLYGEVADGFRY